MSNDKDNQEDILHELIELDEDVNYYILDGHKGESISSRCGRAIERVYNKNAQAWDWAFLILAGIIQMMPWFGANHCMNNIDARYEGQS